MHQLVSLTDFKLEYQPFANRDVVVIGRGKAANKYLYKSDVPVFCINTALQFYPNPWYIAMVEFHYKELKDNPIFDNKRVILISKKEMHENQLAYGCTPSIFISAMMKLVLNKGATIYLQGFSMDEERNIAFPSKSKTTEKYDWVKQVAAFRKCFHLAKEKGIKLILIDENKKLHFIERGIPKQEYLRS